MVATISLPTKTTRHMIIGDDIYYRSATDRYKLKASDLGNGHLEMVAQRVYEYKELELDAHGHRMLMQALLEPAEPLTAAEIAEREQLSAEMGAKRAATRVRRLCKVIGANTMFTGTYRANVQDQELCKRHVKEFVRRVKRVIPGFRCIVAFERQKRKAWHFHMATTRMAKVVGQVGKWLMKSYNFLRAVWRSVTKELGGTINVRNSKRVEDRSPARIASYLSKYITKAFEEGAKWSNRWTHYGEMALPKPVNVGEFDTMLGMVQACYDLIDGQARVVDQHLSRFGDFFFIVVENQRHTPLVH